MLTQVSIGQPIHYGSLTVFPLFYDEKYPVPYILADEAMETGTVTVNEISDHGSVPELVVENQGEKLTLFLEGEQLIGAKQNRILNTSVLIAAKSRVSIPVSCVEAGRWQRNSAYFKTSKFSSPYSLRHALKKSVSYSLKAKQGHRSDQHQVWDEVRKQQESLGVSSSTRALSDTYAQYEENLEESQSTLLFVPRACGLAVALGSKIVTVDLFDKPATCEKVWNRLLSGLVLDSMVQIRTEGYPETEQVEKLIESVKSAAWTKTETVGEGQEYRAEFDGKVGSALVLDGVLVHGSVVVGAE